MYLKITKIHNLKKNSKLLNSKLTMIMEESSIKSSRMFDSE